MLVQKAHGNGHKFGSWGYVSAWYEIPWGNSPMLTPEPGHLYRLDEGNGSGPVFIEHGGLDYTTLGFSRVNSWGHWETVPLSSIIDGKDMFLRVPPGAEVGSAGENDKLYQYYSSTPYSLTADNGSVDGFQHPDLSGHCCFFCDIGPNSHTTWWCRTVVMLLLYGGGRYYRLFAQYTDRWLKTKDYPNTQSVLEWAKAVVRDVPRWRIRQMERSEWKRVSQVCSSPYHIYYVDRTKKTKTIYPDSGEYSFWFSRAYGGLSNSEIISPKKFAEAFTIAQDKLPKNETNGIANVLDVINTIRSLKSNPSLTIDKTARGLKSAWLAYRYSYSTTVSDIKSIANLCDRLDSLPPFISSYGSVTEGPVQYMCCIRLSTDQFIPTDMKTLNERLKAAGMQISATNVWDMIPFSFVVDWFADISAYMEGFDAWISASRLQIAEVWYSGIVTYPDGRKCYFRWLGSAPIMPTFTPHVSNNGKTWLMRIADAISLY